MKLGIIIELIYQRISGGRLSPDVDVKRVDIKSYLPSAINTAIREQYFNNISIRSLEKSLSLLPDQFIKVFEDVEVKKNERRDLKYVDFPSKPIAILDSYGLKSIMPMKGDIDFAYLKNKTQVNGYEEYFDNKVFFWVEGSRAYFKNISPMVNTVLVSMIASIDALTDDDEAPIPIGLEEKVINNTCDWFIGQRSMPQDKIENYNRDDSGNNVQ